METKSWEPMDVSSITRECRSLRAGFGKHADCNPLNIPVPNWHSRQIPICRRNALRVMYCPLHHTAGIGKTRDGMALLCEQQAVVPDGTRAINTSDVDHRGVVVVAGPDAHHVVGGVADRPIVAEILRGAGFRGGRADGAGIAFVALRLRIAVQVEGAA